MNGPQTRKYELYFAQEKERLIQKLKKKLVEATYETEQEVLSQFNFFVNDLNDQLISETVDGKKRFSWFRKTIIDKFRHDKSRYKKGFQVDGFIANILPEIQQDFRRHYENADERARLERYFDQALAIDPDPEEIIKLLALYDVYMYFFDHKQELLRLAIETIQKEKHLAEENHFNKLAPVEMLKYMEQLQQINPKNQEPFLTEKQVSDLNNMICRDQPVTNPIKMNLMPEQRKFIVRFIYEFYKYCKDTVDSEGTRKKYLSILTSYIDQFAKDQDSHINEKNFAREQPNSPIKIDPKFTRWRNA